MPLQKLNESELAKYLPHCPSISETANYWFFRTEGGSLFEPFITAQCIAIGYPDISLKTLMTLSNDKRNRRPLTLQVRKLYPQEKRPGLSARQLLLFTHEMKAGDYVIIPSVESRQLAIGRLVDKPPFQSSLQFAGAEIPGFTKQRHVRWLKRVSREAVNPNLYRLIFTHQTVTNVTSCGQWIDPLLYDFFRKGAEFYYVIEVKRTSGINARDLFQTCVELFDLAEDFTSNLGVNEDSGGMNTRINLNSPGEVVLITAAAKFIFVVAAIVVAINGGGLKFQSKQLGINLNISTDGLIKSINKFLSAKKNRQLSDTIRQKLEALQIADPKDVVKIIDHINKPKL